MSNFDVDELFKTRGIGPLMAMFNVQHSTCVYARINQKGGEEQDGVQLQHRKWVKSSRASYGREFGKWCNRLRKDLFQGKISDALLQ